VAAYAALSGSNQMLWLTFAPLTTPAATRYGTSVETIGWLAQIFPLVYVVLAVPAGLALDRWLVPALSVGALLNGVGGLVRLFGDGFGPVLAGQLMIAVAQPLILGAVTLVADRSVRVGSRTQAIAYASAGLFAGMLVALTLAPAFGADRLGSLLVVQAAIAVTASAAMLVTMPRGPRAVDIRSEPRVRAVLADPQLRVLLGISLLGFGVFVALTTWLQALLAPAGVSATAADVMLLLLVGTGVLGGVLLPAPVISRGGGRTALRVAVVVATAACVVLAVVPGVVTGLVMSALIGLVLLTALPIILTLVEQRAGDAGATATGLVWLAGNAGGIAAALLVQATLARPGLAFALLAVVMVMGLPLLRRAGDRTTAGNPEG